MRHYYAFMDYISKGKIMNEFEKDYSLLRAFDEKAAKRGEKVVFSSNIDCLFLGVSASGPFNKKHGVSYCVEFAGDLHYVYGYELQMAPLCWVEGRPVYEGDEAYGKATGKKYVASKAGWYCDDNYYSLNEEDFAMLTWTKPAPKTVKRTVKYLAFQFPSGRLNFIVEGSEAHADAVNRHWVAVPAADKTYTVELCVHENRAGIPGP